MIRNLLYKEFKLAAHPTTYLFLALAPMMLIPSYPYYVQFLYVCMSLFFIFLAGNENKDIFYMVMLPVRKSDVVKARCLMLAVIELAQIILSIPFAILSIRVLPGGTNQAGIDANLALYGFIFGLFAVFNLIFVPVFYRTAYKVGIPFLLAGLGVIVYYGLVESLVWIPTPIREFLNTTDPAMVAKHLPILLGGIAVWVLAWLLAYKLGAGNFEKVDL
jgi:hypothetical protein